MLGPRGRSDGGASVGKPEQHDVAVLDDVVLALEAHLAGLLGAKLATGSHIVVEGDGFGADEALLEIGMDAAGGARRLGAGLHGPGTRLLGTGGKKRKEVEQPGTPPGHAV